MNILERLKSDWIYLTGFLRIIGAINKFDPEAESTIADAIEACVDPKEGRNVDLRGPFRADIDRLAPTLRICRNAILHVPHSGALLDARIVALVSEHGSALMIRRVSRGFARLFLAEYGRRDALNAQPR